MTIQLRPEDEQLVQKCLQSGAFSTVDEIIHRALETLELEESWLVANKEFINEEIDSGLAELDRGEGETEEQVRAWMAEQKQTWRAKHTR